MFSQKRIATFSLFLIASMFWSNSRAADNVCVINNSSYAVTFTASSQGNLNVGAKDGDKNQCWHFTTAITLRNYQIGVVARKSGVPTEVIPAFGFTDPVVSSGFFFLGSLDAPGGSNSYSGKWNPNNYRCSAHVCAWHTDKTDVWRLYIIDKP